ncbi:hypothetical protein [Orrella sp. 11846]|uniref:hypothetical protein n=1 Tax=Orrella sp. 11846 TaxID=3409913 RepID=UPI003B58E185
MNTIEKRWATDAGFDAVVVMTNKGHRCGYVALPDQHPLTGVKYDEAHSTLDGGTPSSLDVHGSITFSNHCAYFSGAPWAFGFDCAHLHDAPDPEIYARYLGKLIDVIGIPNDPMATHKTLDFCIAECEKLANQLKELN